MINNTPEFYQRLIIGCKLMIGLTLMLFIITILISYPYAEYFSIPVQVAAHIFTIVFAGIFKLACVLLMVGLKEIAQLHATDEVNPATSAITAIPAAPPFIAD